MTKKIKIKDLEDEPNLPLNETEFNCRVGVDVDELHEDVVLDAHKINVKKEKHVIKEKIEIPIEVLMYFKRNTLLSFFSKLISTSVIILILEFISHSMKFFEDVNIKDIDNFQSMIFNGNTSYIFCKIVALLLFIYFITNKNEVTVNKNGIYVTKGELIDKVFFTTKITFLPWNNIKKVTLKMRMFEPFVFFYNEKNEIQGYLEFSLLDKKSFFKYVEQYAGSEHPFLKVKEQGMLL